MSRKSDAPGSRRAPDAPSLKRPLPAGRTLEQLRNHYWVEKAIATRLRAADREQRKRIYPTMYAELFAKVPDHPRLTRREDAASTARANRDKLAIVGRFLDPSITFAEFGPGDCRFAFEVAGQVKKVIGIDISSQVNPADRAPSNFELVLYDGYDLDTIAGDTIDVVFSDNLIEHFHPQDTALHFQTVHRILKPGGRYVFRTPHAFTGPHDVSKFFCDRAEGFHLKEWTFTEISRVIETSGYSRWHAYRRSRFLGARISRAYAAFWEAVLGVLPGRSKRWAAGLLLGSICAVAVK